MAFLDQLKKLVSGLSFKQRISLIAAAVAVIAGLIMIVQWRDRQDYQVLYKDMAAEDAAQVVARLKESGAEYQLEGDGTVIKVRTLRSEQLWRYSICRTGEFSPRSGRRIGAQHHDHRRGRKRSRSHHGS